MIGVLAVLLAGAGPALAEVSRVEVIRKVDVLGGKAFEAGAYEMLDVRVHYTFDPANAENRKSHDIALAPRNARGLVEATGNALILQAKDPARRSKTMLVEVSNRGRHGGLHYFNIAPHPFAPPEPTGAADFGDGFLMDEGVTLVMLGWQYDVPPDRFKNLALHLSVPVARERGRAISQLIRADWTTDETTNLLRLSHAGHITYTPADPNDRQNVLTYRTSLQGPRTIVPRSEWSFAAAPGSTDGELTAIRSERGFQAGRIYELVYRARDPRLVGLGLAAIRDFVSYAKYDPASVAPATSGIAFGYSQTGRLLRDFLYQGFNTDEKGRKAYDGMLIQVAGAGRGQFNYRFAQPSRDSTPYESLFHPVDLFPFTSLPQADPRTGERDGLLSHQRPEHMPLIFQTNSTYEYWGRAASLVHTTADGLADTALPPNERVYLLSGTQHSLVPAFVPPESSRIAGTPMYEPNISDFRLTFRALTKHLIDWVAEGTAPPPSTHPRIADGTLVPPPGRTFPTIPGVRASRTALQAYRLNFGADFAKTGIITQEPPTVGEAFPVLVPQSDGLGNDLGGIRPWELRAPLGTFMASRLRLAPWNTGEHARSGEDAQVAYIGAFAPLARTEAERAAAGDSRPSVEALYPSKAAFMARAKQAAADLIAEGFLLRRDAPKVEQRASALWDWVESGANPFASSGR
jgi:hypothetical protein